MGQADERRNPPDSPIGQLLKHLGMTREDLQRHSSQMREFLTTDSIASSLPEDPIASIQPGVDAQSSRQQRSRVSSLGNASAIPQTPVKPRQGTGLHKQDTMEAIIERQNKLARKEKRGRRDSNAMGPPSPTPRPATLSSGSSTSTTRESKHESSSRESETQVGCFSHLKRHASHTWVCLKQPLIYSQGSFQPSKLKFKVIMFTKLPSPCNSTVPRHLVVPLLPFHHLRHLLPLRQGVLPLSSTSSHLQDLHRTMTTRCRMLSHPVPILPRNRTSHMLLSSDKRFCHRRSIALVSSTSTSGYPRCTRTINEQTRFG